MQAPPAVAPSVWEISGNAYYSQPPGSDGRVTAIVYGDRGPLHLEGRYGYEDAETAALFVGWNYSLGEEVSAEITPMLGAVVGQTDGVAPGLEVDLGWKRLSWYTEAEYLFDLEDSDDDYLYTWSTLTCALGDSWSAGVVTERTKQVDTDYDMQRGLVLEFRSKKVGVSVYAYNIASDDFYSVVSVAFAP